MITYYFKTVQDNELSKVQEPRNGVWVHAEAPSDEEREALSREFALDEAILEDAKDFYEMPRFERSGNATYFFARYPYPGTDEEIDTAPILIVVGESFVLTYIQKEAGFLSKLIEGKGKKEGETMSDIATTQKTKLFLQIMSALTNAHERELVRVRKGVHKDQARLRNISSKDIERLVAYEHKLNDTLAAVVPTSDWLEQVMAGNYIQLYKEDLELIEDLRIANDQLIASSKSLLKTIQNIRSASEAILTSSLNTTVRVLTALTILLTVPTVVASLYGMNVALPLSEHPHAFWLVIVFVVTVVSLVTFFFVRNRWL